MKNKYGTGLLPLPENPGTRNDISHAVVFGVLGAAQLPQDPFDVATPLKIKDQISLDFCSGFASSEVTEDQEGEEMDPFFQFAAIKRHMGDPKPWGADLRSAGMALVKYGSLPQSLAPYTFSDAKPRDFLADWTNFPVSVWERSLQHKKKSMFFVGGPHSLFENIIMTLWQNKAEKCSILLGVMWRDSWSKAPGGVIPEWTPRPDDEGGEGHCIKGFGLAIIDGKRYLKIQNSWGEGVGDRGVFYFPASVVNKEFGPFGQILFRDMDPETAHYYNQHGISVKDNWLVQFFKIFTNLFTKKSYG